MNRWLLVALMVALLMPSATLACNCRATRAQRFLAYKAYKEKMALERQRLLIEQKRERQREREGRREGGTKHSVTPSP
jgi:hypothetical protein